MAPCSLPKRRKGILANSFPCSGTSAVVIREMEPSPPPTSRWWCGASSSRAVTPLGNGCWPGPELRSTLCFRLTCSPATTHELHGPLPLLRATISGSACCFRAVRIIVACNKTMTTVTFLIDIHCLTCMQVFEKALHLQNIACGGAAVGHVASRIQGEAGDIALEAAQLHGAGGELAPARIHLPHLHACPSPMPGYSDAPQIPAFVSASRLGPCLVCPALKSSWTAVVLYPNGSYITQRTGMNKCKCPQGEHHSHANMPYSTFIMAGLQK